MKCWGNLGNMLHFKSISSSWYMYKCTFHKQDFYLKICFVKIQIISTLLFPSLTHDFRAGLAATKAAPQSIIWCFIAATVFLTLFVLDLSIIPRQEVGNGSGVEMDMNYVRRVDFWQSFGSLKTEFWESILNVFRERLYNRKYLSNEIIYL